MSKKKELLWVFSFVLLGFLLRITFISSEQFWFDEILSLTIARYSESIPRLIQFLQHGEYHPPFYYIIMFFWTRWFGISELTVRSFSLLFGILSFPLFYIFAKRLFNEKVALFSLFFLTINPLHIEFSKEGRPYTFFIFFGLLASYFLLRFFEKRNWYFAVGFIFSTLIGWYTHYSFFFISAAHFFFLLLLFFKKSVSLKNIFTLFAPIFIGFLPWFPTFIKRYIESQSVLYGIAPYLSFPIVKPFWFEENFGNLIWLIKKDPIRIEGLLIFIGHVILFFFFVSLVNELRKDKNTLWWKWIFLASLTVIPVFSFLGSSYGLSYSTVVARHFIFAVFPLMIILGYAVYTFSKNKYFIPVLAIFLLSLIPPLQYVLGNDSTWSLDHRVKEAARFVEEHEAPGDMILVNQHLQKITFEYYYRGKNHITPFFPFEEKEERIYLTNNSLSSLQTKFIIHLPILQDFNKDELKKMIEKENRIWLVELELTNNFLKFLIENDWKITQFSETPYTFPTILLTKS